MQLDLRNKTVRSGPSPDIADDVSGPLDGANKFREVVGRFNFHAQLFSGRAQQVIQEMGGNTFGFRQRGHHQRCRSGRGYQSARSGRLCTDRQGRG